MKPNSAPLQELPPTSCDEFQQEISEARDENRPHSAPVVRHLALCSACSHFEATCRMEDQLRPVPALEPALAARLLESARRVGPPPLPEKRRHLPDWLAKAAAIAAFVSTGWWLLNPRLHSPTPGSFSTESPLPLAEIRNPASEIGVRLSKVDASLLREKDALSHSLLDGLAHVQRVLLISHSVLP
jgi:hypothetical protein